MVELKPIKRIVDEYRILLERYEDNLENFTISDYKRLIGEIKMFWYRNRKSINYLLSHITEDDKVAFLAGAVRLDIMNNGHYEYVLVGKVRLINEPLLKMAAFYNGTEDEINFDYTNQYVKECIQDTLILLREYEDDFYILPIEYITMSECEEYSFALSDVAEKMILSMFSIEYNDIQDFCSRNKTYEDIENNLLPQIKNLLIFCGLEDLKMSLRGKCNNYLKSNGNIIPFMKNMGESQLFSLLVMQFCMQAIAIVMIMDMYHMIPFIRNDVTFQYFTILSQLDIASVFIKQKYLNVYIPYVVQKTFDFSDYEYNFVKIHMGNEKMIDAIINMIEEEKIPVPEEIIKCVENYISSIE